MALSACPCQAPPPAPGRPTRSWAGASVLTQPLPLRLPVSPLLFAHLNRAQWADAVSRAVWTLRCARPTPHAPSPAVAGGFPVTLSVAATANLSPLHLTHAAPGNFVGGSPSAESREVHQCVAFTPSLALSFIHSFIHWFTPSLPHLSPLPATPGDLRQGGTMRSTLEALRSMQGGGHGGGEPVRPPGRPSTYTLGSSTGVSPPGAPEGPDTLLFVHCRTPRSPGRTHT